MEETNSTSGMDGGDGEAQFLEGLFAEDSEVTSRSLVVETGLSDESRIDSTEGGSAITTMGERSTIPGERPADISSTEVEAMSTNTSTGSISEPRTFHGSNTTVPSSTSLTTDDALSTNVSIAISTATAMIHSVDPSWTSGSVQETYIGSLPSVPSVSVATVMSNLSEPRNPNYNGTLGASTSSAYSSCRTRKKQQSREDLLLSSELSGSNCEPGTYPCSSIGSMSSWSTTSERPGAVFVGWDGILRDDGIDNIIDPPNGYTEIAAADPHVDNAEIVNDDVKITRRLQELQEQAIAPINVMIETESRRMPSSSPAESSTWLRCKRVLGVIGKLIAMAMLLISPLVALLFAYLVPSGKDANITGAAITDVKMTDEEYLQQLFHPISGDQVYNVSSSRFRAIQFLDQEDNFLSSQSIQDLEDHVLIQRYAFFVLLFSSGTQRWITNNARKYTFASLCDFYRCDDQDRLLSFFTAGSRLVGTIPPELSALSSLEYLNLAFSEFSGSIPVEIFNLYNLKMLQLSNNHLSGTIPKSVVKLRRLQALYLDSNKLTGSIPGGVFQMDSLEELRLGQNSLTGTLPEFTSNHLREIDLILNNLIGSVPPSIYHLKDLERVSLHGNLLRGEISWRIGSLRKLKEVHVHDNFFTGGLPSTIGLLTNLQSFTAFDNLFHGSIPSEIGNLSRLQDLVLSNCHLEGELPSRIGSLSALKRLSISGNKNLMGQLPASLSRLSFLGKSLQRGVPHCIFSPDLISAHWAEVLEIHGTKLQSGAAIEALCNNTVLQTHITANCGEDGDFECPCCASCCDKQGTDCSHNVSHACVIYGERFHHENGYYFEEPRATTCNCNEDGKSPLCSDYGCATCNEDGSICALSKEYGYLFDTDGHIIGWQVTLADVDGHNENVTLKERYELNWDRHNEKVTLEERYRSRCTVSVGEEVCKFCGRLRCSDGTVGYGVLCDQFSTDTCTPPLWMDGYKKGPLIMLDLLGGRHRKGCAPRVWPIAA